MSTTPEPDAGPCPQCRSTNTRRTLTVPPHKHPNQNDPCHEGCSQPTRLCLNCRLATPLPTDDHPEPTP